MSLHEAAPVSPPAAPSLGPAAAPVSAPAPAIASRPKARTRSRPWTPAVSASSAAFVAASAPAASAASSTPTGPQRIFSVYYHNSVLKVKVGDRVQAGQVISLVGNTGRATNDHLHLEVHTVPLPAEDLREVVDSLERFPAFTTNPELWIEPLPGMGIVAGQVFDAAGQAVPQARIYGLAKPEPAETSPCLSSRPCRLHPRA